jgi:hypothetical protein
MKLALKVMPVEATLPLCWIAYRLLYQHTCANLDVRAMLASLYVVRSRKSSAVGQNTQLLPAESEDLEKKPLSVVTNFFLLRTFPHY